MANIMADGNGWNDQYTQPPACWTGTEFDVIGANNGGPFGFYFYGLTMTYFNEVDGSGAKQGDICNFTATNFSADATELSVSVNGSTVYSGELSNNEKYEFTGGPYNAGDQVTITVGSGDYLYSQDMKLVPTAEPAPDAFWTDFIGTQEVDA